MTATSAVIVIPGKFSRSVADSWARSPWQQLPAVLSFLVPWYMWGWSCLPLWRGSLLPLGRAAAPKIAPVKIDRQGDLQRGRCAAQREKAPSPQRRSDEHTAEVKYLMRSAYAVFCLKKNKPQTFTQRDMLIDGQGTFGSID